MHRQAWHQTVGACTACQPTAIWPSPLSRPVGRPRAGASPPCSPTPARSPKAAAVLTLPQTLTCWLQRALQCPCQRHKLQVHIFLKHAYIALRHALVLWVRMPMIWSSLIQHPFLQPSFQPKTAGTIEQHSLVPGEQPNECFQPDAMA